MEGACCGITIERQAEILIVGRDRVEGDLRDAGLTEEGAVDRKTCRKLTEAANS